MKRSRVSGVFFAATLVVSGMVPRSDFSKSADSDGRSGRDVFESNCSACHSATTRQTRVGPGLKGLFKTNRLPSSGRPATVRNVLEKILKGGGGMPGFERRLTRPETRSLIQYLKSL